MTIQVGLLHSQSGPMAIAERPLLSAELVAIDEINQNGGILGHRIEAVMKDGQSDPVQFAQKAEELVERDHVAAIFGCWTSSARKSVKPVVEQHHSVLWYPIQYEGLEQSDHIIYTGSCLNQQISPAVEWAMARGVRKVFLVGSDYVFPRTANRLIRAQVLQEGGRVINDLYAPLGADDFSSMFAQIQIEKPDMIFNTINGESNLAFFREYARSGLDAGKTPVMSFSFSEIELAEVKEEAAGHFACWGYFQGITNPKNTAFIAKYRQHVGPQARISDPVVTAYSQVYLWKQIAEQANAFDPLAILKAAPGVCYDGPGGLLEIYPNHHVGRQALIGQAGTDGQFRIVWESETLIAPKPWLGLEDMRVPFQGLIHESLERFPEVLHINAQLEQEIVRRKHAEALLQERARRLLQLNLAVEQSPASVVITDLDGVISYVNPQFTLLTGYTPEEAIGRNASIVQSGLTPEKTYQELWQTIKSGQHWHGEFINRKKNGELYWELAIIAPVKDEEERIINFIAVKEDITERKQAEAALQEANQQLEAQLGEIRELEARLREQAIRDPLTNLYNRRFLFEMLEQEIRHAARHSKFLSIILLDIDHFKTINDTYGHAAGDACLVNLAHLLRGSVRESDIVCRYGGEEFLLLLPDCDLDSAAQNAEELRLSVQDSPAEFKGEQICTTISLGIAVYPLHGASAEEIIQKADQALYVSKYSGRNQVTTWAEGMAPP